MNAFPVIAQKAYSKTEARQGQGRDYRESIGRIYPPPPPPVVTWTMYFGIIAFSVRSIHPYSV